MKMKTEKEQMLEMLPNEPKEARSVPGDFYFKIPTPNCFVCKEPEGNIAIYPVEGGYLRAKTENFEADVAPFHG
jgi:hypothetical protein